MLRGAKLLCTLVSTDRVSRPIFVYRVCTAVRQDTPTRMQVLSHADLFPDQLLSAIAGQHPDLRDTWADGGWQLCAIDAREHSRDRSLMHPCYILIQVLQMWHNGAAVDYQLVSCFNGFFIQITVEVNSILMDNIRLAAPLIIPQLHIDPMVLTDPQLLQVTVKSFTCTSMADQRRYVPYQEASPA